MSGTCDSSMNVMKNPVHESGFFEDGSDIEMIVEETIDVGEEVIIEHCTEACYGLSEVIDDLDDSDLDEPVPDDHEDKSNKGKSWFFSKEKYIRYIYRWFYLFDLMYD